MIPNHISILAQNILDHSLLKLYFSMNLVRYIRTTTKLLFKSIFAY